MILVLAVGTTGEQPFARVTNVVGIIVGTFAGNVAAYITDVVVICVLAAPR
jgi:hypothetical protein